MNRKSSQVFVRGVAIGGGAPITIQTMTTTKTKDVSATLAQILQVAECGADIVRVAVPDMESASVLGEITSRSPIPVVADIHYDWRLAMEALRRGIDKLRINPGNLLKKEKLPEIAALAKEKNIPLRIGVNEGSLSKRILQKHGGVTAEALVESACNEIDALEALNFTDIVISVKTFSVPLLLRTHQLLAAKTAYPFHIGVTESGSIYSGSIRSAVGIGALLCLGFGDTIRVSLTADPVEEVRSAKEILTALELRRFGPTIISCPTCGRTEVDLMGLCEKVTQALTHCRKEITVAVMGCSVNGPGEARNADVGIAGGRGEGILFRKGKIVKKVSEEELFGALMREIDSL